MGAFDAAFPGLAASLTCAMGTEVAVAVMSPGGYDPTTREASPSRSVTYASGVLENYTATEVNGQVKATDLKLHIAALDMPTTPKNGDEVDVAGRTMRIVSVRTEYAGGAPALYTCQVRA